MTLADTESAPVFVPALSEPASPPPRFTSVSRTAELLATHASQLERP